MGVNTGITSSTSQVLVLTVRDVEMSLWVTIFLGKTKVNHVDLVAALADAHQEVIWLYVTVDERFGVDVLDARDQLISKQKHRLQGEFAVAEVEEILQAGAKEIDDHRVVVTFGPEPTDKRDTDTSSEGLVDTSLIFKLWVLGLDALKLNGNLFARDDIGAWISVSTYQSENGTGLGLMGFLTKVDITETTAANLAANAVFIADT
jgi:hypothetical protein